MDELSLESACAESSDFTNQVVLKSSNLQALSSSDNIFSFCGGNM